MEFSVIMADESEYFGRFPTWEAAEGYIESNGLYEVERLAFKNRTVITVNRLNIAAPYVAGSTS